MSSTRQTLIVVASLLLGFCVAASARAAPIQPFDAVVQSSGGEVIYVRSGPGQEKHYPTLRLSNGDQVHVLRKDPGGWFMIDPPPGSYSWILSRYVQKNGTQATVTENGVIVRVGAFESTQRDVEQIRLSRGDSVEILGEQVLDSDKGKDLWIKIKPPRGEHRWIKGSHLVELNPDGSPKGIVRNLLHKSPTSSGDTRAPTKSRSPSKSPAIASDDDELGGTHVFGQSPKRKSEPVDPFEDLAEGAAIAPSLNPHSEDPLIREDLKLLDVELRQILARPQLDWDFRSQREDLLALKQLAGKSTLVAQIDDRLKKLEGYEHDREAALIAEQRARPSGPQGTRYIDPQRPGQIAPQVTRRLESVPGAPPPGSAQAPSGQPRSLAGLKYNGAGIIQRLPNAAPGMPAYVIAAPDRRILCYLDSAPNVNLGQYVGQAMGLTGPRGYDPRLKADRMRVDSLTPVRLAR